MMFEAKIHGCEIKGQAVHEQLATIALSQKEAQKADQAASDALARVKARFANGV